MSSPTTTIPPNTSKTDTIEVEQYHPPQVPSKKLNTDYPLIDNDPHISRVLRYARGSDYAGGAAMTAFGPALMYWWERISPSEAGRGGFAAAMRLNTAISLTAGFLHLYSSSAHRFYGFTENRREIEMDMREMTDKVKQGKPLYGTSTMTEYMQGAAHRQSRYTAIWSHIIPWFNFVNHNHHGVDTAKYYQNAEKELEAERNGA